MTLEKPGLVVAVFGSTGNQGGSTVRSLVKVSKQLNISKIICMTRKPDGKKAKELVALHTPTNENGLKIEPCFCDWFDEACLMKILSGVDVVFAMTDYWSPDVMSEEKEYRTGINIVKAANANHVKLFIWSSLDDATKITKGKYHVPHFTAKARVDDYLIDVAKKSGMKWVIVKPGAFFTMPVGNSKYASVLKPDTKVPFFDPANDTGLVVAAILKHPEKYYGKSIRMFGEYGSYQQMSKIASKVLGKDIPYVQLTDQEALQAGFNKELIDMLHYFNEFGYYQADKEKNEIMAPSIVPNMTTMENWLKQNL